MAAGAIQLAYQNQEGGLMSPGQCLFTNDLDGPFVDTGRYINFQDPYGYISVKFVEEMGRAVGMVGRDEVEALETRLREALVEVEAVKDRLGKLEIVSDVLAEAI